MPIPQTKDTGSCMLISALVLSGQENNPNVREFEKKYGEILNFYSPSDALELRKNLTRIKGLPEKTRFILTRIVSVDCERIRQIKEKINPIPITGQQSDQSGPDLNLTGKTGALFLLLKIIDTGSAWTHAVAITNGLIHEHRINPDRGVTWDEYKQYELDKGVEVSIDRFIPISVGG